MTQGHEALLKKIEEDRDFALRCLQRGWADPQTIRKLVARLREENFQTRLPDLMLAEGLLTADQRRELDLPAKTGAATPTPAAAPTALRKSDRSEDERPSIPGYEVLGKLSNERSLEQWRVRSESGDEQVLTLLPAIIDPRGAKADRLRSSFAQVKTLNHPMIVNHDKLGTWDGRLYYTTEYVPGRNLAELLRHNGPFPSAVALGFIKVLAGVLDHAHSRKVVHHDLQPGSIVFLPNRQPRLRDFGLERVAAAIMDLQDGEAQRCFRSPEDLKNENPDPADDLFALGALLFFVVTGHRPPRATRSGNVAIPDLTRAAPDLSPELVSLLTRLLLPKLARIGSIQELRQALDAPPSTASPATTSTRGFNSPLPSSKNTNQDDVGTIFMGFGASPAPSTSSPNKSPTPSPEAYPAASDTIIERNAPPLPKSPHSETYSEPHSEPYSEPYSETDADADATVVSAEFAKVVQQTRASMAAARPTGSLGASRPALEVGPGADPSAETIVPIDDIDPNAETLAPEGSYNIGARIRAQIAANQQAAQASSLASHNATPPPGFDPTAQTIMEFHDGPAPGLENDLTATIRSDGARQGSPATGSGSSFDAAAKTIITDFEPAPVTPEVSGTRRTGNLGPASTPGPGTRRTGSLAPPPANFDPAAQTIMELGPEAAPAEPFDPTARTMVFDEEESAELTASAEGVAHLALAAAELGQDSNSDGPTLDGNKSPSSVAASNVKSSQALGSAGAKNSQAKSSGPENSGSENSGSKNSGSRTTGALTGNRSTRALESLALAPRSFGAWTATTQGRIVGPWELLEGRCSGKPPARIKVLDPEISASELGDKILESVSRLASAEPEHFARILGHGRDSEGRVYFVIERVEGKRLNEVMSLGQEEFLHSAHILTQLLKGLNALEKIGIVHADLTEDNLLIARRDGQEALCVVDISFASILPEAARGEPGRLPPELQNNSPIGPRADVFCAGLIAYRLFTGAAPYGFDGSGPRSLSELRPGWKAPPGLDGYCRCAVAKNPDHRFASASEMLAELRAIQFKRGGVSSWIKVLVSAIVAVMIILALVAAALSRGLI